MELRDADAGLYQEMHIRGWGARRYEQWAAKQGWNCSVLDALASKKAKTAKKLRASDNVGGVGIATRTYTAVGKLEEFPTVSLELGRAMLMHWSAVVPGGIVLGSIYCTTGLGATGVNSDLVWKLAKALRQVGLPFIVGGDWQMEAEELRGTGVPQALRATVVYPLGGEPSCKGYGGQLGRTIDMFLVADVLMPWVKQCSVRDMGTGRHRPVRLEVHGAREQMLGMVVREPRRFPEKLPFGPRLPSQWGPAGQLIAGGIESHYELVRAYQVWSATAEKDLLMAHGIEPKLWKHYEGRGTIQMEVKEVVKKTGEAYSKVSKEARSWRRLACHLSEMGKLADIPGGADQAHNLWRKVLRWRPGPQPHGAQSVNDDVMVDLLKDWAADVDLQQMPELGFWVNWAQGQARKAEDRFSSFTLQKWKSWAAEALANGAGAGHNWSKEPGGFRPAAKLATPGQQVEDLLCFWEDIWGEHDKVDLGSLECPQLPDISADEVFRAAGKFKYKTGLGGDFWHPRDVLNMQWEGVEALAMILTAMERLGRPPLELLTLVTLDKPDGGHRLIALITGLVRLHGRIRRPMVRAWERAHDRSYFWAKAGRSAPSSAYIQQLKAEIARAKGEAVGSTLLDLVKCYEKIRHKLLVDHARRYGYPLALLRLNLAVYSGPRVISYGGCVSRAVQLGASIAAGCSAATALLKLVLIPCFDEATELYSTLEFFVFVDDTDIDGSGEAEELAENLVNGTRFVVRYLEAKLQCPVSREKSKALGSSQQLRGLMEPGMSAIGIGLAKTGKKLGVTFSADGVRRTTANAKRWKVVKGRTVAVKALARAASRLAAKKIVRAGMIPAGSYGSAGLGASLAEVRRARGIVSLPVRPAGQLCSVSLYSALTDHGADPAFKLTNEPVMRWASLVWDKAMSLVDLDVALMHAQAKWDAAKMPWQTVTGPAGALVGSLARIGWRALKADRLQARDGRVLHLAEVCPRTLGKVIDRELERWCWEEVATRRPNLKHLAGGADTRPMMKLLGRSSKGHANWGPLEKASLLANVTMAAPSQSVLHSMGRAESDLCQVCGEGRGTYYHRHFGCPRKSEFLRQYGLPRVVGSLVSTEPRTDYKDAAISLGLVPDPRSRVQPAARAMQWVWGVFPEGGLLSGEVYLDGSAYEGNDSALARAGWGAVQLGRQYSIVAEIYGTVEHELQEPGVGELLAVANALRVCLGPVVLLTDYQGLVDGFRLGPEATTGSGCKYADAWAKLWHAVEDYGASLVQVRKVPAHLSLAAFERKWPDLPLRFWYGNRAVDQAAKKGAALHRTSEEERRAVAASSEFVDVIGKYIGRSCAFDRKRRYCDVVGMDKVAEVPEPARRKARKPVARVVRQAVSLRAEPELGFVVHESHKMESLGPFVFCTLCGASASGVRKVPALSIECRTVVTRGRALRLSRLSEGKHPRTGVKF